MAFPYCAAAAMSIVRFHRQLDPAGGAGHQGSMRIYKILRPEEWDRLRTEGESAGAPIDQADGFVHFSTAAQVAETAAKHFAGTDGLVLLAVAAETLGPALRWEKSRNDALFPHLYGPLRMRDVLWARPLPLVGGAHQFPDDLT
ncbi:DUF952 domain-containing protein [Pontibaca methylaminivorans]|uniref:DUF952 domain-containing protein n=1 Tax=Pontibaca methylaminivorans TaxID=515897 RepID=UPI002FD91113